MFALELAVHRARCDPDLEGHWRRLSAVRSAVSGKRRQVADDLQRGLRRHTTIWELLYNHYVIAKKFDAPDIEAFAAKVRPEGRRGDYGPNSGGFDWPEYGTLTFTLK
ncbi:conserved hypothetical protein [Paraburkholderia piptadeniae]|uniref:Uncharacterized protein n=1 Tax=Paraburkholderia piptadeniae TaxID=1701573 RepID=A0A1N7SWZ2_9BURK|nr:MULTISPECIES: hypothetical protein [Paraburkholderia]SIT51892.1 conserved hypothetical protein [Paraburkholderia piptadeniae]